MLLCEAINGLNAKHNYMIKNPSQIHLTYILYKSVQFVHNFLILLYTLGC